MAMSVSVLPLFCKCFFHLRNCEDILLNVVISGYDSVKLFLCVIEISLRFDTIGKDGSLVVDAGC